MNWQFNDILDDELLIVGEASGGLSEFDMSCRRERVAASVCTRVIPLTACLPAMPPRPSLSIANRLSANPAPLALLAFCSRHRPPPLEVANEFGKFGLPKEELMDMLSGKRVALSVSLNFYERQFRCDCSPDDLETQLQLVHLLFTAQLRPNSERVKTMQRLVKEEIIHQVCGPPRPGLGRCPRQPRGEAGKGEAGKGEAGSDRADKDRPGQGSPGRGRQRRGRGEAIHILPSSPSNARADSGTTRCRSSTRR